MTVQQCLSCVFVVDNCYLCVVYNCLVYVLRVVYIWAVCVCTLVVCVCALSKERTGHGTLEHLSRGCCEYVTPVTCVVCVALVLSMDGARSDQQQDIYNDE
jgi:hypothetical protein